MKGGRGTWSGGAYPFVACLRHLTNDHASLPRRSTVPTPNSLIQTPPPPKAGGGGHSFVACFSRLTIDHATPSRQSTVSTPRRSLTPPIFEPFLLPIETPPIFERSLRFFHILHQTVLLIFLSPSRFAVGGMGGCTQFVHDCM